MLSKNNTLILHAWFLVLVAIACTKEIDETKNEIIIDDPVLGKLISLKGIVTDSLGTPLSQASVKAVFGDFEYLTETDQKGAYQIGIPETKKEGYLIAVKKDYSRSVLEINTEYPELQHHYLNRQLGNLPETVFESFSATNLFLITGRVIDSNGQPIAGQLVSVWSFSNDLPSGFFSHGSALSNHLGLFAVLGQKGSYERDLVFSYTKNGSCRNLFSKEFDASQPLILLGDLEIDLNQQSTSQALSIKEEGCYSDLLYWSFIAEDIVASLAGSTQKPTIISYCNNLETEYFFIGGNTWQTSRHFEGKFYSINHPPDIIEIDYCKPEGIFFNGSIGTESFSYSEAEYNEALRTLKIGITGFDNEWIIQLNTNPEYANRNQDWSIEFGKVSEATGFYDGKNYSMAPNKKAYYFLNENRSNPSGTVMIPMLNEQGIIVELEAQFRLNKL